jgi:GntR family transcriptional regulator, transcriptional repressor for pyruvate dehydrogenase complex
MIVGKDMFQPIKGKRTFEEVSDKIKSLVIKGILKVGDRLPSEAELARQFSVGRQSVREALRLLELSGSCRQDCPEGAIAIRFPPDMLSI